MKITKRFYEQQPRFIVCVDDSITSPQHYSHLKFYNLSAAIEYSTDLSKHNFINGIYIYEKGIPSHDNKALIYKRVFTINNQNINLDNIGNFVIVLKREKFTTDLYHSFLGKEKYLSHF